MPTPVVSARLFSNPATLEADVVDWIISLGAPVELAFSPVGTRAALLAIAQETATHALSAATLEAANVLAAQTLVAAQLQAQAALDAAVLLANGTSVLSPPNATVLDDEGNVWTIDPSTKILRNGSTTDITGLTILFTHHHLFVLGFDDSWYLWQDPGWLLVSIAQPGT